VADLNAQKGLLSSILDEVARPGEVVRNLLAGRWESAGRQAGQLGLNLVDSVIPGDWLPNDVARPEDYLSGRELVGAPDNLLGKAAGLGVDMLTDPLSYLPGGLVAKGARQAGEIGAEAAAKVVGKDAVEAAGRHLRSTFGVVPEQAASILTPARAAGSNESMASMAAIRKSALAKLSPDQDKIVADLLDNLKWGEDGKVAGALAPESKSVFDRIASHPGVNHDNQALIEQALNDVTEIGKNQKNRPGIFSIPDPDPNVFWDMKEQRLVKMAEENPGGLTDEYLGRKWTGQTEDQKIAEALGRGQSKMGAPGSTKELTLDTPEKIAEFMKKNPDAQFSRSAIERMADRAQAQGTLTTRAEIGKKLLGDGFEYADSAWRGHVEARLAEMAKTDPESAKALTDAFSGMAPRGTFTSWLATANKAFKPFAVYGFGIPKFGAIVRNKVSGIWQALSNPESRAVAGGQAKRLGSDLAGAVVDSLGLKVGKDKLGHTLDAWESALAQSKGSADTAIAIMSKTHPEAAAAIKAGAIDGFVRSEDLVSEMARTGWKKKFANIAEWPARMFRGVEDRMRLGMSLDLMAKGKTPEEAAKIVRDSLYDYSVNSTANRTARDVVPFFNYMAKAIPQQAKFMAEKPAVASALANAMAGGDGQSDPTYAFMDGKLNIPLGDHQYISGLGLPFETLSQIPNPSDSLRNFGRQIEQNVVGSSQPLLKGAFSTVAGEDPYFGTEFGSYDKIPVVGSAGAAGRLYNEAAAFGLPGLTPADQLARTVGHAIDDRKSPGLRALDLLTGANVVTVDPNQALQQRLNAALAADPTIRQISTPVATGADDETKALIDQLRQVKAQQKAKRAAEVAKGDVL
jgi:hypothetical protein